MIVLAQHDVERAVRDVGSRVDIRSPRRQLDKKQRSIADRALEADDTTHAVDDLLDDAQPEPGAAFLPRIAGVRLGELVEYVRLELVGNAGTMIAHGDTDGGLAPGDGHHDLFPARGEFDGIGYEIGEHLRQPVGIGTHVAGDRFGIESHADAEIVGIGAVRLYDLLDDLARIDRLEAEGHLSRLDLLDVEDVIHQAHQALAVIVGDLHQPRHGHRQPPRPARRQQRQRGGDRGERRAQFVAHRGDELVLQPFCALALADIHDHGEDQQAFPKADRIKLDLDREFAAVLAHTRQFAADPGLAALRPFAEAGAHSYVVGAHIGRHQLFHRLTQQFLAPVAEQLLDFAIDHDDGAAAIDHHHAARAGLDGKAEQFLG